MPVCVGPDGHCAIAATAGAGRRRNREPASCPASPVDTGLWSSIVYRRCTGGVARLIDDTSTFRAFAWPLRARPPSPACGLLPPSSSLPSTTSPPTAGARSTALLRVSLILANVVAWLWALDRVPSPAGAHGARPVLGLSIRLGLRRVDADHIAAIDNVTRKLDAGGPLPYLRGLLLPRSAFVRGDADVHRWSPSPPCSCNRTSGRCRTSAG